MKISGFINISDLSDAAKRQLIDSFSVPQELFYGHEGVTRPAAQEARTQFQYRLGAGWESKVELVPLADVFSPIVWERRISVPPGKPVIPPNANSKRRHRIMRRWERQQAKAMKLFAEWMQKHIEKVMVYGK